MTHGNGLVRRCRVRVTHNKLLDASDGSEFRNLLGAAEGYLIRAAASTQPVMQLRNYIGSESAGDFFRLCQLYPQTATLMRGSQ